MFTPFSSKVSIKALKKAPLVPVHPLQVVSLLKVLTS